MRFWVVCHNDLFKVGFLEDEPDMLVSDCHDRFLSVINMKPYTYQTQQHGMKVETFKFLALHWLPVADCCIDSIGSWRGPSVCYTSQNFQRRRCTTSRQFVFRLVSSKSTTCDPPAVRKWRRLKVGDSDIAGITARFPRHRPLGCTNRSWKILSTFHKFLRVGGDYFSFAPHSR